MLQLVVAIAFRRGGFRHMYIVSALVRLAVSPLPFGGGAFATGKNPELDVAFAVVAIAFRRGGFRHLFEEVLNQLGFTSPLPFGGGAFATKAEKK